MPNWFHIVSLGTTIDLNFVCAIQWNRKQMRDGRCTELYLATGIATDEQGVVENDIWSISDDVDRQNLLKHLFPDDDCPIRLQLKGAVIGQ
ncbi:hypothetical protein [Microcoleus sp. N9_A1]|uniref:hypothetical protein n=1 Tax=Microcoleus sp. N9_A1 TaxID=3055380 RepID=UPI002FD091E6